MNRRMYILLAMLLLSLTGHFFDMRIIGVQRNIIDLLEETTKKQMAALAEMNDKCDPRATEAVPSWKSKTLAEWCSPENMEKFYKENPNAGNGGDSPFSDCLLNPQINTGGKN